MDGFLWAALALLVIAALLCAAAVRRFGRDTTNPDDWGGLIGVATLAFILVVLGFIMMISGFVAWVLWNGRRYLCRTYAQG